MLQMIRSILADPTDKTKMSLVYANRYLADIMMKDELDATAEAHADRFTVHYVLSKPPASDEAAGSKERWAGGTGWVSAEDITRLPKPSDDVMVLVCGRDEFLTTVSGMTVRGPPPPGSKKKKGPKEQGPLSGLLAAAGYTASMVYKF